MQFIIYLTNALVEEVALIDEAFLRENIVKDYFPVSFSLQRSAIDNVDLRPHAEIFQLSLLLFLPVLHRELLVKTKLDRFARPTCHFTPNFSLLAIQPIL